MLKSNMIPIFKSTYSIGKSILTLDDPSKVKEGGSDSIIAIAKEENLDKIVLVEDSMIGFLNAHTKCAEAGIQLIFGLRMSCINQRTPEFLESTDTLHKIVLMGKNDAGIKVLTKIYSIANKESKGIVDCDLIKQYWTEDLKLCIPFYDSFIYMNNFIGRKCVPNFSFTKPTVFIEDNDLPFDQFILEKVSRYAQENNLHIEKVKSIYYKNKEDFSAWQTYKCLCNRTFGKERSLSNPNLEHCGSDTFCWESYKQYER